ncbi:MAG: hypothetical protein NTU83_05810, partial [Candidatus Hydrogenedentes bacterium]|nr:hypothetical protein [Candidatus Hydrogenedentota bacterium]
MTCPNGLARPRAFCQSRLISNIKRGLLPLLTASRPSASFSIEAIGSPPILYQWSRNGATITDAISAGMSIDSARPSDAGYYSCAVANAGGSTVSNAATLTIEDGDQQSGGCFAGTGDLMTSNGPGSGTPSGDMLLFAAAGLAPLLFRKRSRSA